MSSRAEQNTLRREIIKHGAHILQLQVILPLNIEGRRGLVIMKHNKYFSVAPISDLLGWYRGIGRGAGGCCLGGRKCKSSQHWLRGSVMCDAAGPGPGLSRSRDGPRDSLVTRARVSRAVSSFHHRESRRPDRVSN